MTNLVLILVALIGAGGAISAARTNRKLDRQGDALGTIQVNVNGRLDRLLKERAEHIEKIAGLEAERAIQEEKGTQ